MFFRYVKELRKRPEVRTLQLGATQCSDGTVLTNSSHRFTDTHPIRAFHFTIRHTTVWQRQIQALSQPVSAGNISALFKMTVFAEINAHPEISAHRKLIFQRGEYTKPMGLDEWFFKGGSTQNRWFLMGDFSKGGVHKTNGCWWVIFQRVPRVHKTDGFWWVWNVFLLHLKVKRPGRLFWQVLC